MQLDTDQMLDKNRWLFKVLGILGMICMMFLAMGCLDRRPNPRSPSVRKLNTTEQAQIERAMLKAAPKPGYNLQATLSIREHNRLTPAVLLYGVDIQPPQLQRGKDITVTYYFKPLRKIATNWVLFLHLEAESELRYFRNHDHQPINGLYPTSRWQPNQIFRSQFTFQLPKDFPGKTVNLYSGFWQAKSGNMIVPRSVPNDGRNRILLASLPMLGKAPQRPIYVAYKIDTPPTIDGKLDEPMWRELPSTGNWPTSNNRPARFRTEARIAWDNRYLYVGVYCEDDDIWSTYTKRDEPLFQQEVVEFFVDANRNYSDYVEMQVSPAGVIFDSFFPKHRWPEPYGKLDYDSGVLARVHLEGTLNNPQDVDKYWTVEMRFPLDRLGPAPNIPPIDGDEWLINLYRIERSRRTHGEALAWSPVTTDIKGGDFHNIRMFGTLRFSTKTFKPQTQPTPKTQPTPQTKPISGQGGQSYAPSGANTAPQKAQVHQQVTPSPCPCRRHAIRSIPQLQAVPQKPTVLAPAIAKDTRFQPVLHKNLNQLQPQRPQKVETLPQAHSIRSGYLGVRSADKLDLRDYVLYKRPLQIYKPQYRIVAPRPSTRPNHTNKP